MALAAAIMEREAPAQLALPGAWPTLLRRDDVEDRTCSVDGCGTAGKLRRGLCNMHYHRWKQHGDAAYVPPTVVECFWAKVQKTETCWLWTGAKLPRGYGQFHVPGYLLAHRYSYETFVGPIPEGYTIDHLCRNPSCVRPEHLEPVTIRENLLRGDGVGARNARKTHCNKGHELIGDNLVSGVANGWRECRICKNERQNRNRRIRLARQASA